MKNISFQLTNAQIRARTKTVTRRMGWSKLKAGDLLGAVEKGMGLKKGEKVNRLGTIRVVSVERQRLDEIIFTPEYGDAEVALEGFPGMTAVEFMEFFCKSHKACTPATIITRIEFEYA